MLRVRRRVNRYRERESDMRGMTWDHARGYDPLVAASRAWAEAGGEAIAWDRRSLQDFESFPVEELARRYDLIVIDHPHVGQVADAGCLAPLDTLCEAEALAGIAAGSVGGSYERSEEHTSELQSLMRLS